jgi:beta-lactamase superfamily II metal-dependent hydrolase
MEIPAIGKAIAYILRIQRRIYNQPPELQPIDAEVPEPDPDLTEDEKKIVDKLSQEEIQEIDDVLMSHAHYNWRKVAMIVGLTWNDLKSRERGIPDTFYAQRIRKLVEEGRLESQGNLQFMRFSEVTLKVMWPAGYPQTL